MSVFPWNYAEDLLFLRFVVGSFKHKVKKVGNSHFYILILNNLTSLQARFIYLKFILVEF